MEDEEFIIKTPINKNKRRNVVLDDEDDNINISINNIGDIDLDVEDIKTPSPKFTRNRLKKKVLVSPSTKSNNSSTNNSPENNNKHIISPLSPLSPKVRKVLQQKTASPKKKSPIKTPNKQEEEEDYNFMNNDEEISQYNNYEFENNIDQQEEQEQEQEEYYNDEEEMKENMGTLTYSPSSSNKSIDDNDTSPSKPTVNKKSAQVKITNRKTVSRTIKDRDVLATNGIRKLYKNLKSSKFSAKHSNKTNLELFFGIYSKWSKEINPAISIEDSIVKIEVLGKSKLVKNHIEDIKHGVYDKDVEDTNNFINMDDDVNSISSSKSPLKNNNNNNSKTNSVNINNNNIGKFNNIVTTTTTKPSYQNPFSFFNNSSSVSSQTINTSFTTTAIKTTTSKTISRPLLKVSLPTRPTIKK
ncbi:hypothetical protein DICPUDRAFT_79191 [Dictyostelium purpureum]|uniref:Chromosome segregation in meiosis protein 3 domain-containing protein n=1 Tax=Dictyostelium purpureum TaxID=5786 RepID=F0ZLU5_DICPU|nr:uncharacterized protein DICPUDRAFT_79191 [Dictyostelium purpureum]EGC35091.1 hypothetical protein DICPUDRAFT_79191 [Dictyostelium purpureum]|eukprot:XP_003288398.1 hypothetical protein DICPUDRAFT_79191 [Dictyostelium purpureum]